MLYWYHSSIHYYYLLSQHYLFYSPIIDGFDKERKDKIIRQLAEMPAKVRGLISEVKYDPQPNMQNQVKLFTTDNLQVVGNLNTIGSKMKYYPQMSQSLDI